MIIGSLYKTGIPFLVPLSLDEGSLHNSYLLDTVIDFPALLPQVYLYYDPLTQAERGYKLFEHQKMDFLMIFSHRNRVVIEIDGKQHYADGDRASPRLYSEMVKAQREMGLYGHDVYRFGGYEFIKAAESDSVKQELLDNLKEFFIRLFQKYNVLER